MAGAVLLGAMAVTAQVSADVESTALVPANEQIPVTQEAQLDVIPQDTGLVTTNTGLDLDKAQSAEVVILSETTQPLDVSAREDVVLNIETGADNTAYEQVALSSSIAVDDYVAAEVRHEPASTVQRTAKESFSGMNIGSSANEQKQLPYALILALIALIGLVPVSRRYH